MPNEDKRRRLDGTTDRLSVAELIARREAETQPIPVVTAEDARDSRPAGGSTATEPTVKFAKVRQLPPDSELHVTELLRREGRDDDPDRGGLSIGKLVAIASGGVVLCGSVAFGASSWLSTPDERPLADVRFDTTDRSTGSDRAETGNGNAATRQPTGQDFSTSVPTTTATQVQQPQQQPEARVPQQAPREIHRNPVQPKQQPVEQTAPQTQTPAPGTETPAPETSAPPSTSAPVETTPSPVTTTPPVSSDAPSTALPSASVPAPAPAPDESTTSPAPSSGVVVDVDLDLGPVLNLLGEFDFFAPAE
ncbi:hypothetical protein [Umezawaea beigongshangensis]|uniref:hypothetical protein n=1 Tax=Umezawaea beigongshangensis TaxID=2780383 RepID=UPI0018F24047|nr:hypothetical protein [Umezawaea beigongshangensis]